MEPTLSSSVVIVLVQLHKRKRGKPAGSFGKLFTFILAKFPAEADQELINALFKDPSYGNKINVIKLIEQKAERDEAFRAQLLKLFNRVIQTAGGNKIIKGRKGAAAKDASKKKAAPKKKNPAKEVIKKIFEKNEIAGRPGRRQLPITRFGRPGDTGLIRSAPGIGGGREGSAPSNKTAIKPGKPTVGKIAVPGKYCAPKKTAHAEKVICHTRAHMDKMVLLKLPTDVTITLSRQELTAIKGKLSVIGSGLVSVARPLTICIRPVLNMRVKGKAVVTADPPTPQKNVSVTFQVIPTQFGECRVAIDVWQDQVPVCKLELFPQCVAKKTNTRRTRAAVSTGSPTTFPGPANQLRITERQEGRNCFYDYELQFPGIKILKRFTSSPITINRADYVNNLYTEIENLWTTAAGNAKQFDHELRNFGAGLFSDLFPNEMQEILFKYAKGITSIQVISIEPYIPWELVLVKKPGNQHKWLAADKYLGELGLTRWLFGWWPAEVLVVRHGRARYVIPEYQDPAFQLPGAPDEKAYLEKAFDAKPVAPDPLAVDKLIRKSGSFDLLHFCCHGAADTNNISHSKLMLQERKKGKTFLPTFLTQTSVEQCGTISKDDNRPIIVLNACQTGRLGAGLIRYSGFANAFLQAGAGAFIGCLWSVEDNAAVTFITTMYDGLKDGKTLAEATLTARKAARKNKDASWISYVVYGNPFARLK